MCDAESASVFSNLWKKQYTELWTFRKINLYVAYKICSKMEFPAGAVMFEATVSEHKLLGENYKNAELGNVSQWNISTSFNINQLHKTYKENIPAPPCHYVTYPRS